MPPERSGVASALLNASREVAGLLGITVIGAVLRSPAGRRAARTARDPASAYLDGYHAGLIVTVALIAAGVVVSYLALRHLPAPAPASHRRIRAGADQHPVKPQGPRHGARGARLASWRQRPRDTRSVAWSSQPGLDSAVSTHQVAPAAT